MAQHLAGLLGQSTDKRAGDGPSGWRAGLALDHAAERSDGGLGVLLFS